MFITIIEYALAFLLVWLFIFQIAIPILRGRRTFPIFRRRDLEDELTTVQEERSTIELERELAKAKADLVQLQQQPLTGGVTCPPDSSTTVPVKPVEAISTPTSDDSSNSGSSSPSS